VSSSSRVGSATRPRVIVAPPDEPKAIIRYAFYAFIFCVPFDGVVGGLFFLGLILAGSTLCQPRFFLKPPPKAFWCFAIYLSVVAVLGLFGILVAPEDAEFRGAIISQLFRFSQLLVLFWISYRLMMFEPIVKPTLLTLAVSCIVFALLLAAGVEVVAREGGPAGLERASAVATNPNTVATVLGAGLLILFGLAYGRKDVSIKVRLHAWLSSGFLLITI
jgi:hypothetical protein